jgi:AcrR family transcriptional regulator
MANQTGTPSRARRRQETVRRILGAAWRLSRRDGLTGSTLRDLGALVGMRALVQVASRSCSSRRIL